MAFLVVSQVDSLFTLGTVAGAIIPCRLHAQSSEMAAWERLLFPAGGQGGTQEAPRFRSAAAPGASTTSSTQTGSGSSRNRLPHVGPVTALVACAAQNIPLLLSTGLDGGVRVCHSASLQEVARFDPFDVGCCSADWCPRKASMFAVCTI